MRLDQYLVTQKLVESRHQATELIKMGEVQINGAVVKKPARIIKPEEKVVLTGTLRYVSRAGYKLEAALSAFEINLENKIVLDVGASTGGFTDCALQHGAQKVYAVDVGIHQLRSVLRDDPRVVVREHTDIRELILQEKVDVLVVDLSFISLTKVLHMFPHFLKTQGEVILLVKPQFEVGKENIGKGGIVKDRKAIEAALLRVYESMQMQGFEMKGQFIESPLKGGDGNTEYLGYFVKSA
jgi:23S rRNA (cytidine1920-2'-O)/16S rRNA (cytidine1409-2'-O)-methyltransferase